VAGKHRKELIERAPSKRQVSKWEKQKRMSRIIVSVTAAVIVVIVGIIGYGIYNEQISPYDKVVLKVNDASFNMQYFINAMDIITTGINKDMLKYYIDYVSSAVAQGELVREKAAAMGITLSDEEVNQAMAQSKLPKNDAALDLVKTQLITQKYVKQYCWPNLPKGGEQVNVQAMFLENKAMVEERKQRIMAGDNFSTTAKMLSMDAVTMGKSGQLGWIAKGYERIALGDLSDSVLKDVIFTLPTGTLSDPIYDPNLQKNYGYWIIQVLEKDDSKGVHARAVLLPVRDQAEDVRAQLLNGASWDDIAKKYSQHADSKDKGGDLGWIEPGMNKGSMLDRMIQTLEPNKISDIMRDETVQTKGGYWLVEVLDHQMDRPYDNNVMQFLSTQCLNKWIEDLSKDAKTENLMDQAQKDFATSKVLKGRQQ